MNRLNRYCWSAIVAAGVSASGCVTLNSNLPAEPTKPAEIRVKSDGACLQLGELQSAGLAPEVLHGKIAELATAHKFDSARRLILKFPDVSLQLVRSSANTDEVGQLISTTLAPAAQLDADRRAAEALLLQNNPKAAAQLLAKALERPNQTNELTYSHVLLLLSEAERRSGRIDASVANWKLAMERGATVLVPPNPLIDPGFWERASYLKPVSSPWPDLAVAAWKKALHNPANLGPDALLWTLIGTARFDRNEPHAALAAFKRAESYVTDHQAKAQLAIAQARVLVQLNQQAAAMTLLVPIAGKAGTPSGCAAMALLGSIRLSEGGNEQALALLKKAIEEYPAVDWPGRDTARADLGLAYLATGNATAGLRQLQEARERFVADARTDQVIQSWENEAAYYRHANEAAKAEVANAEVLRLEAGR